MKWLLADKRLVQVVVAFVVMKAVSLLVIYLAFRMLPFCEICHRGNFVYPVSEPTTWQVAYKTWDGQHYLYLAEKWYSPGHIGNAFHPLLPVIIRLVAMLGGNYWLAGMVLVSLLSIGAVILMYLLIKKMEGNSVAIRATMLFMSFPTAFYLHVPYTEGLFLTLALAFFLSLYTKRFWVALVSAFLLPLSRDPGITLIIPLLVYLYMSGKELFTFRKRVMLVSAFVLGWLAYMAVMKVSTGVFSGMQLHKTGFVGNYSLTQLLHPWEWLDKNFLSLKPSLHGFNTSIINRVFFGGFIVVFWLALKRLDRVMIAYMIMTALVPALSGFFMSYPRMLLVVFPMYIVLAKMLRERTYWLILPMLLLQGLFLVMHALNYWVA